MIEACAAPVHVRVAERAVFREVSVNVARISRLVVIGDVTALARCWDRLEISS
jgi:hypothetical protein